MSNLHTGSSRFTFATFSGTGFHFHLILYTTIHSGYHGVKHDTTAVLSHARHNATSAFYYYRHRRRNRGGGRGGGWTPDFLFEGPNMPVAPSLLKNDAPSLELKVTPYFQS